ncbi:MAG: 50S ribosomal protein L31 [Candidatus Omnitrophica bacterium]|nr:50S ribosomal protein L31 [Candidatus Omnitrophota bacterium]
MKEKIHPEYGAAMIQCACGNRIETRSTVKGVIQVDVCSACHPFFTGKQKLLDAAGRIDRFKKKFEGKVVGTKKWQKAAPAPLKTAPKKLPAKGPVPAAKDSSARPAVKNPNQEKLEQVRDKINKK